MGSEAEGPLQQASEHPTPRPPVYNSQVFFMLMIYSSSRVSFCFTLVLASWDFPQHTVVLAIIFAQSSPKGKTTPSLFHVLNPRLSERDGCGVSSDVGPCGRGSWTRPRQKNCLGDGGRTPLTSLPRGPGKTSRTKTPRVGRKQSPFCPSLSSVANGRAKRKDAGGWPPPAQKPCILNP